MPILVSEVLEEAAALLNDQSKRYYKDEFTLPLVKRAWRYVQTGMLEHGIPFIQELSAPITVNAEDAVITLPSDLLIPIALWERAMGAIPWTPVHKGPWDVNELQGDTIRYWEWREDNIQVLSANTQRQVQISYYKSSTVITGVNSSIPKTSALPFLASYTAYLAAALKGSDPERAEFLAGLQAEDFHQLFNVEIHEQQSLPVRPRPWPGRR